MSKTGRTRPCTVWVGVEPAPRTWQIERADRNINKENERLIRFHMQSVQVLTGFLTLRTSLMFVIKSGY